MLMNTHMFLWRTIENYPSVITKYHPYLFHCPSDQFSQIVSVSTGNNTKCVK